MNRMNKRSHYYNRYSVGQSFQKASERKSFQQKFRVADLGGVLEKMMKEMENTQWGNNSDVKKIIEKMCKKIDGIRRESDKVYIVNAGNMNHGKSTLFNSLLDKDVFKAEDVRTTVKAQEEKYKDNVYLVDTPGVDANDSDDAMAKGAYEKASFVIFVHNPMTGELHSNEITWINHVKELLGKQYFDKHFCIVLTFKDGVDEDGLAYITQKIRADLNKECNLPDIHLFVVSNTAYRKGLDENKKKLEEISGFPEFKNYLDAGIPLWEKELKNRVLMKIDKAKQEALVQLQEMSKTVRAEATRQKQIAERNTMSLTRDFEEASDTLSSLLNDMCECNNKYQRAQSDRAYLESKHEQEKRNY